MRQLVLGGVRSGKSRYAEGLAKKVGLSVTYIATARAGDDEMKQRIQQHQAYRPADWVTLELFDAGLPRQLAVLLQQPRVILLDCLTLWLTQLLCAAPLSDVLLQQVDSVLDELVEVVAAGGQAELIMVGNETGLGIMPMDALSRAFGDRAGLLHQRLAAVCERVVLTVAGLPLSVKG
ncbi:MAG TPA: bifunctional adenosylcobinamide kinase/adenosylcobinamide-phosphate guanylyltransferase [Marinospirillum sp.]|uniref:bifunctional adenosylcobinamide kinase/adenosylcobinamide-phosphate guanylyltransferase n=1 Tax=Marinospirillum sp. TaxID=2183934 RepID=UPI002B47B2A0|nr:bifunctional adenosylcobinamide kinase/adenosylcobinamide-phosphate guanylyltransferase [Marinospirillum sp.]HKM16149.1 bifunctional adenosylcobinamide kinase/adenosylcobinamide-phosphate guanylyltransferase [Marinospirillum sp.]